MVSFGDKTSSTLRVRLAYSKLVTHVVRARWSVLLFFYFFVPIPALIFFQIIVQNLH
jgi:hypothetical protein